MVKLNKINCLAYALRFWSEHRHYKIVYNSDHAINIPKDSEATGFLGLEKFGLHYFKSAFDGLLNDEELLLLNEYFNNVK